MIYIGIDPGLTGAVAVLEGPSCLSALNDIPTTATSRKGTVKREVNGALLADLLRPYADEECLVTLERTAAGKGQGVASMFSMGVSRGVILGVLGALRLRFEDVTPQAWKKHFRLLGADKDASRTLALRMFPHSAHALARVKDHNRAEALLLAAYGRDKEMMR